jgi:cell division protease FtsH
MRPTSSLHAGQGPESGVRERRNLRSRARLDLLSRSGGPVRFWPAALFVALLTAAIVAWRLTRPTPVAPPVIAYSEFARALASGRVTDIMVDHGGSRIVAELRVPQMIVGHPTLAKSVATSVPARGVSVEVLERWAQTGAKVRVSADTGRSPEQVLQLVSFLVLVGGVGYLVVRQRGDTTKGRFLPTPPSRHLTLADVGGVQEARADVRRRHRLPEGSDALPRAGRQVPEGDAAGRPARHRQDAARARRSPARRRLGHHAAGSDFNEMYVGVGSKRVRQLAEQAREAAPCIVLHRRVRLAGRRRGRPTGRARRR